MNREIKNNNIYSNEHFYVVNYPTYEKELCEMEIKYLFGKIPTKKYFFSDRFINPSRSPFIKHSVSIKYLANTLEEIIHRIKEDNISYDDFKVIYIKSEDGDVEYSQRLKSVKDIGFVITGFPDIHNPKVVLAISKIKDTWIFGEYKKNDYKWHSHDDKPYSYSNALSLRVARAIVNIAVENNLECKLIDPCCGVGTVVIEALDLGVNVRGYELSKSIAFNARENVEYFGYKRDIITMGDMHTIKERFDVAVVDIPYGLFSPVTLQEQIDIINTSRRIAEKLVIITFEDMDSLIQSAGFRIVDKCCVSKNNFKRYISVCE